MIHCSDHPLPPFSLQPTQRPNELEVGVYPDAVCEAYFGTYNYSSSSVCVGTENPFLKRPCGGDSGGALVCKRGNRDVLYGMVSAGPLCGVLSFSPDVFTRITKYIRWIQEKVAPFGYRPSFQERFNPFRPGGSFQWWREELWVDFLLSGELRGGFGYQGQVKSM